MKTLVELSLHNIHDGKIIIDGEEVYNFEKFFEQYNNYNNFSERIIQFEIEKAIVDNGEAVDNIKHTLKYYNPQIIRIDKCFEEEKEGNNDKESKINLGFINKVLASINYYLPKVTQMTLTNNNLDKHFNSTILPCIKLIKNLNMLDLSNNKLNEENIKGLFEYLKQNETIKKLYLNDNNISSFCGYYMADCFKKNNTIEILHLANNKLNDNGFESFLNIIQNDNTTLKELNISYNELKSQDFKSLSKYFNSNPSLKKLDLSGNKLGPQDSNVIGVTFKKLTNLEELKLNNCGISDESVGQLFNFLNESSIQHLEIDSNNLGMTGPMVVMKKIQVSNKLKYFSYKNMAFQPYFVGMIIKSLSDNPGLETINLMENKIKDDELKQLVNGTSNLKNKKIILSKDKLNPNALEIINGNKNIILQ
jgi:Ran GTPase-activating protein (RanGAP) involved in mRNA processing and transport